MANNYKVNYNDERFRDVEADKKQAINEVDKTFGDMIGQSNAYYQAQINASKQWEKKQTQIQNQQTDFAIQEIEQQKAQAQKDYTREQSGAYVDWQKQSDQYGANAEAMAAQGMQNTGYSESSQVSMFNTYQNRVVAARESYNLIVQDFNNAITEARLQNNAALAEIAFESQQQRLELALEQFNHNNQLLLEKASQKREVENEYYGRYQDVLAQINTENALAEQIRQYNEKMAEEKRQFNATLAEEQRQYNASLAASKSSGGSGRSISKSSGSSTKKSTSGSSSSISKSSGSSTKTTSKSNASALNAAIAAGASKDKVSNAISLALRNGQITQKEATELRKTFTPRGYTY
jgi:hypothetical protein